MTTINQSITVPYTPQEMFELVDTVEQYADFLPWCSSADILSRTEDAVSAKLNIQAKGVTQSFSTTNHRKPYQQIDMHLLEGPFRSLEGCWRFLPEANEQCQIDFNLTFEFSNRLIGMALGRVFHHAISKMIDAFYQRAKEIYGQR